MQNLLSVIYHLLSIYIASPVLAIIDSSIDSGIDSSIDSGGDGTGNGGGAGGQGIEIGTIGGEEGFGPWGNIVQLGEGVGGAAGIFAQIISNIVGVMTIAAGIWFIFQFIIGAFNWLTAGGDKARVQAAQQRITNAFIGLTMVVAAYAIIWVTGKLFGFEILHPEKLIPLVGPGGGE